MKTSKIVCTLVFLLLFTGCGTAATTIDSSTLVHPTVLHVARPATYNNVPAFERTIYDAVAIQSIFKAAYALQPAYKGIMSCPVDLNIAYHLTFLSGAKQLQIMTLRPTGCRSLQIGQDTSNMRSVNDTFLQLVAKTIGLSSLVPKIG